MSDPVQYLLDTNVLSETRKRHADEKVLAFVAESDPSTLYISVLTLGELRKGVALKHRSDPSAAESIATWVDGLEFSFADRILGIDAATARLWGELSAERPRPVIDTLLAATAVVHGLTLVTRNTSDVQDIDVKLHNPFAE
ncbi:MAG: type II toxin-antitoxin system VapC family toxin [Acidobacteriaceae bacterium]|jgi:predicted nucleic acid-binding protein